MGFFSDLGKAAVSSLLVMALFEVGLRLTGSKYESSFYESDPVLYMTWRPNAQGWEAKEGENFIRINSLGMRDRERTVAPAPGVTRVALLGDSVVAAGEVPLEQTAGRVLESKLRAAVGPNHPVEVLNFGVGGYTLSQEYLLLQTRVWAFHPDIVILLLSPSSVPSCDRRLYPASVPFFVLQNGEVLPDPRNRPPAASSPGAREWHALFGDLMNRVRLLQMIRKATQDGIPDKISRMEGRKRQRNKHILAMWIHSPSSLAEQNAWQVAEGMLGQMAAAAQLHRAEFWLSAVGPEIEENPDLAQRDAFLDNQHISGFNYAETRFQSIAAAHGIHYISLEPQLLEYAAKNQLSLRGFFNTRANYGHWNENGNAAAATILADSLLLQSPVFRMDEQSSPSPTEQALGDP
jgi:hypothetical protein